jgi:hypothetical protein
MLMAGAQLALISTTGDWSGGRAKSRGWRARMRSSGSWDAVRAGEAVLAVEQRLGAGGLADDLVLGQVEDEVPVLVGEPHGVVEADPGVEELPVEQPARVAVVARHERDEVVLGRLEVVVAVPEELQVGIDEADALTRRGELGHEALDRVGQQDVVGVDGEEVAAAGGGDAGVPGRRRTGVFPHPDHAHPLVGLERVERLERLGVGRAVVDDDDLDLRIVLSEDRGE